MTVGRWEGAEGRVGERPGKLSNCVLDSRLHTLILGAMCVDWEGVHTHLKRGIAEVFEWDHYCERGMEHHGGDIKVTWGGGGEEGPRLQHSLSTLGGAVESEVCDEH